MSREKKLLLSQEKKKRSPPRLPFARPLIGHASIIAACLTDAVRLGETNFRGLSANKNKRRPIDGIPTRAIYFLAVWRVTTEARYELVL